ncbi:phosphate acyltransferase PlsX [candidate division KSB1 bacterium]|nr:phosphate acyltransferase PlsX [candidate division KSB1 bacterium]
MKIAVDAMGGDFAPEATVDGAIQAARVSRGKYEIILVGDEHKIRKELSRFSIKNLSISIYHASEVIEMEESPTKALKQKKDASMVVASNLLKKGMADAVVSAGNTGAFMATSLLTLGRLPGVLRPGLGSFIPNEEGVCVVIDVGANSDCKPINMLQFATMGSIYMKYIFDIQNPKVGLLSIGEEESKGNELVRAAHKLLKSSSLNFIGNMEGRDILKGTAEVVVCDGFVGNIVLKFAESIIGMFTRTLKKSVGRNIPANLGAILMKPAFRKLSQLMDYQEYGGVPLLGLNGICIVCHGRSTPKAIRNAIREARKMFTLNLNKKLQDALGENTLQEVGIEFT